MATFQDSGKRVTFNRKTATAEAFGLWGRYQRQVVRAARALLADVSVALPLQVPTVFPVGVWTSSVFDSY